MRVYCRVCGKEVNASAETMFVWTCDPHGHLVYPAHQEVNKYPLAPTVGACQQEAASGTGDSSRRPVADRDRKATPLLNQK